MIFSDFSYISVTKFWGNHVEKHKGMRPKLNILAKFIRKQLFFIKNIKFMFFLNKDLLFLFFFNGYIFFFSKKKNKLLKKNYLNFRNG